MTCNFFLFTLVIVSTSFTCCFFKSSREKKALTLLQAMHDFDVLICRRLQTPRKVDVYKLIQDVQAYTKNMHLLLDLIEFKNITVSAGDSICEQNGPLFLQIPVKPHELYSGFRIYPSTVKPLLKAFYKANRAWKVFYYWICISVETFREEMKEYMSD